VKTSAAASAVALAVLILSGCRTPPAAPGESIVMALASSPTNLDPGVGLDESSQRLHQLIFSSLLRIDDTLRNVPDLAVRFDMQDPQTYIAEIPRGVRFHDGREMTSADVAYTFRRFLDPALVSGKKGAFQDLAAVDILDGYTVAFRLKRPSGSFAANLTNLGIVPDGTGATQSQQPIGSGPYRLVEFVPDDHVTLERFDGYYRGPAANTGLVFKVVPDETMRSLELRKGDVDLVVNDVAPDLVHGLGREPGLAVFTGPGTDYAYIGLNLRDPILGDRRVRQALAYAVDRAAIVRYLQRDLARETPGIIPSMSWAFAEDAFMFTHDVERAKVLLDEAGYRDPDGPGPVPRLRLTLKTSTVERYRVQAAALQQQFGEAGIALDIRSHEFATLFADVIRGNVQLYTLVFTGGSVADPDILRRVFHSSQVPPSGFNRARYANPEVDRLIDQATAAITEPDRRRLYADAQRLIAIDAPMISLWARTNVAVAQSDLTGITLTPIGDLDFLRHVKRRTSTGTVGTVGTTGAIGTTVTR
jgi:peptide/nickel transport system substrate-binding protein